MTTNRVPRLNAPRLVAMLILTISAAATPVRAGQLATFHFGGVIDDATDPLEEGDRFSGSFTYDLDAMDSYSDDPTYGDYTFRPPWSAPGKFSYEVGPLSFRTEGRVFLELYNDTPGLGDRFSLDGIGDGGIGDAIDGYIFLEGSTLAIFGSDRPPGMLNLADFSTATFGGTILVRSPRGPVERTFSGTIDTLTLAPSAVPEPSGIALMATGGLTILAFALRRTRRDGKPPATR